MFVTHDTLPVLKFVRNAAIKTDCSLMQLIRFGATGRKKLGILAVRWGAGETCLPNFVIGIQLSLAVAVSGICRRRQSKRPPNNVLRFLKRSGGVLPLHVRERWYASA